MGICIYEIHKPSWDFSWIEKVKKQLRNVLIAVKDYVLL